MNGSTREAILIFAFSAIFSLLVVGAGYWFFGGPPATTRANAKTAPAVARVDTPPPERPPVQIPTEGHPSRGPQDAPVTIVEFSDYECPYCARVYPSMKQIEENYKGKVRRVFRQFPLTSIHPRAQKAAEASLCALDQGKFWEMHEALFAQPSKLEIADLYNKASLLGLNAHEFRKCVDSGSEMMRIKSDIDEGTKVGVTGTPAIFINGRYAGGARPYEGLAKMVDEELQRSRAPK